MKDAEEARGAILFARANAMPIAGAVNDMIARAAEAHESKGAGLLLYANVIGAMRGILDASLVGIDDLFAGHSAAVSDVKAVLEEEEADARRRVRSITTEILGQFKHWRKEREK